MSVLDKFKFWKKEDDFDFDKLAEKEIGGQLPENLDFEQDNLGLNEKSHFTEESSPEQSFSPLRTRPTTSFSSSQPAYKEVAPHSSSNKDLELINSKLDTLKALLASLDQRLERMERSTGSEKKEKLW